MYHQGGSAIQAPDHHDLQTLYLMNPNNVQPPHTNVIFLNSAGASTAVRGLDSHASLPQAQEFVGFPPSQDPNRPLSFSGQQDQYQTAIPSFDYKYLWRSVDHDPNTSLPTSKSLSLSLSSDQTAFKYKSLLNDQDLLGQSSLGMVLPRKSSGVENKIMDSKYLKAAQQILDEVANVGEGIAIDGFVRSKDKADKIIKASSNGGEDGGDDQKHKMEPRQEIQMKIAKLVAILDEVEQRYSNYQQQMHMLVALFEQTAGIGSSKRYTHLASRTISKQFRCLKDEISSQISVLKNSLRDDQDEKFEGSRLEFPVHRFRQQSAWRTQRGLPERAVSVLRAWLFDHFLHPYPKDQDKKMMAKQTGLTRNQVSNWFINSRVRLWKPMVEEMYLEEMKNQQQIYSEETTTKSKRLSDKELGRQKLFVSPNDQPENCSTTPQIDQLNAFQSKKHNRILNQVINPSTFGASFAELIGSLNMENSIPTQIDPKKARKDDVDTDQDNSPNSTNLISQTSKGFNMSVAANTSSSSHGYFRRHDRSVSTEQKAIGFRGNSVSLTLALPPSASSHWSSGLSQHQQNLPSNSTFEFGNRILETGIIESGSRVNGVQDSTIGYEVLDFQNRNPFPAMLLPDFMA